jgi:hypothetical protein
MAGLLERNMIALLLAGCSGETAAPAEDMQGAFSDIGGPGSPEMGRKAMEEGFIEAMETGMPSALQLRDLYEDFMLKREPDCPHMENQESDSWGGVWYDDCSTAEGYRFFGNAYYEEEETQEGDLHLWTFNTVSSFELTDPDGETFTAGGEFESEWESGGGGTSWFFRIGGTYTYSPKGGWLASRGEASLYMDGEIGEEGLAAKLDGGIGLDGSALYFNQVLMEPEVCGGLPQGEILVRDGTGFWFSTVLEDCSGCGQTQWRDEELGESCIGGSIQQAMDGLLSEIEAR